LLTFLDFYRSPAGVQFLKREFILIVASACTIFLVFYLSEADRSIAKLFFDTARNAFPLKSNWLLEKVLHRGARTLSVLCALAVVAAAIVAWLAPLRFPLLARRRATLTFVAIALVAAPAVVGALKHYSTHACPWDIAQFGGTEPFRHLFEPLRAPMGAEGCLPAAHPVSGFAWMALAPALYPRRRAWARTSWWSALTLGLGLGFVQMLRGAHFLSHVLWSAWVVWTLQVALLTLAAYRPAALQRH
jgi:membrane-associated PAP2 superfamily phosphatase